MTKQKDMKTKQQKMRKKMTKRKKRTVSICRHKLY